MTQQDYPPDFRALCAELVPYLQGRKDDEYGWPGPDPEQELLDHARAALAQPEPVERPIWTEGICGDGAAILKDGVMQPIESVIAALNAAEQTQSKPQGPTDEELLDLGNDLMGDCLPCDPDLLIAFARAVLTRWGS